MAKDQFLSASWLDLILLNYEVDPKVLAPFVPKGTELLPFGDQYFVSLVGFRFVNVRLLGLPIPFHREFDEINLRFYVKRETPDGTHKGVVFIKEIVPKTAVALVARWVYNEKYVRYPMRREFYSHPKGYIHTFDYSWKFQRQWFHMGIETNGELNEPAPHSHEEFLIENYWGYVEQRNGFTMEYQVQHPPWRIAQATKSWLNCDVGAFYGQEWAPFIQGKPSSAFIVEGSPVTVGWGKKVQTTS